MKLKVDEIKLNPDNPRTIKDDNFQKLVRSIKEFPEMAEVREVVVNKDYMILGGNMRFQAMKEAGWKEIPVRVVDWPEDKQKEFIIKDDRGISTIIEAKNPKQLKENIVGLAQLMNAKMAFDYHGIKNNYMLITSVFSPFIMKFILEYNLPFDLCMVSNKNMALWRMYENI